MPFLAQILKCEQLVWFKQHNLEHNKNNFSAIFNFKNKIPTTNSHKLNQKKGRKTGIFQTTTDKSQALCKADTGGYRLFQLAQSYYGLQYTLQECFFQIRVSSSMRKTFNPARLS